MWLELPLISLSKIQLWTGFLIGILVRRDYPGWVTGAFGQPSQIIHLSLSTAPRPPLVRKAF
jgi:hypothetical protein